MTDPMDVNELLKRVFAMGDTVAQQAAQAEVQQRQRTAIELNVLDGQIVVLQANLKVAQAEAVLYQAELLSGAELTDARRQYWSTKVAAAEVVVTALQEAIAAHVKLYETLVEGAQTVMSAESTAQLMKELNAGFRKQLDDLG